MSGWLSIIWGISHQLFKFEYKHKKLQKEKKEEGDCVSVWGRELEGDIKLHVIWKETMGTLARGTFNWGRGGRVKQTGRERMRGKSH